MPLFGSCVPEAQKTVLNVHGGLSGEYPREFEREVTLKEGVCVRIRPVLPEDETRLVTLYGRLSQHTAYQRFFIIMKRLPLDWAHYFANVDYCRRMALVAERALDWRPELIGAARYEPSDEKDTAEVALVVQDYWQGQGLGSLLLREILRAGEANGIRAFRAHVLADNHRSTTGCLLAPSRQCSVWPPSQSPVPALGFTHINAVT